MCTGQLDASGHITRIGDLDDAPRFLEMIKRQELDGKAVVYPHRRTAGYSSRRSVGQGRRAGISTETVSDRGRCLSALGLAPFRPVCSCTRRTTPAPSVALSLRKWCPNCGSPPIRRRNLRGQYRSLRRIGVARIGPVERMTQRLSRIARLWCRRSPKPRRSRPPFPAWPSTHGFARQHPSSAGCRSSEKARLGGPKTIVYAAENHNHAAEILPPPSRPNCPTKARERSDLE